MQLTFSEFLATIPELTHDQARTAARDYAPLPYLHRIEGPVRKTQVETGFIINGTEERLKAMLDDPTASETQKMLAAKILKAMSKLYQVEFYINLADPEVAQMFSLAHTLNVLNNDEATRITEAAMYIPAKPWPNTTLYEVRYSRGDMPTKELIPDGRFVTVTTNADCEKHNASIYGFNPRTQQWQSIQAFRNVEKAGTYDAEIPSFAFGWQLRVDDAYGVM
ncbi:hypothetical protein [Alishewanella sp. HL-SH06]|uniref:hypothetical protein n=1 Tax=Alishewanella sp. HL-SH06 TaxID=3461144 RepID=UPI004041702D